MLLFSYHQRVLWFSLPILIFLYVQACGMVDYELERRVDYALASSILQPSVFAVRLQVRNMMAKGISDPYSRFITPSDFSSMRKYDVSGVGLNLGTAEEFVLKTGKMRGRCQQDGRDCHLCTSDFLDKGLLVAADCNEDRPFLAFVPWAFWSSCGRPYASCAIIGCSTLKDASIKSMQDSARR